MFGCAEFKASTIAEFDKFGGSGADGLDREFIESLVLLLLLLGDPILSVSLFVQIRLTAKLFKQFLTTFCNHLIQSKFFSKK